MRKGRRFVRLPLFGPASRSATSFKEERLALEMPASFTSRSAIARTTWPIPIAVGLEIALSTLRATSPGADVLLWTSCGHLAPLLWTVSWDTGRPMLMRFGRRAARGRLENAPNSRGRVQKFVHLSSAKNPDKQSSKGGVSYRIPAKAKMQAAKACESLSRK